MKPRPTTWGMRENFHLRCLQCILWIQRLNKVPNSEVLKSTNMDSMFALLCEWHLHCLGHISQMELGCILEGPGELMKGLRPSKTKHPRLHFKDVCKKDMKLCSINTMAWKPGTLDRSVWRLTVRRGVEKAEENRAAHISEKRARREADKHQPHQTSPCVCDACDWDCHSWTGLLSHAHWCWHTWKNTCLNVTTSLLDTEGCRRKNSSDYLLEFIWYVEARGLRCRCMDHRCTWVTSAITPHRV